MPELPEVETIVRDLRSRVLKKNIKKVEVLLPRIVKPGAVQFKKVIVGNSFKDIRRVGKLMVFGLASSERFMLVHLKMTGQLVYVKGMRMIAGGHSDNNEIEESFKRFARVIFYFEDGSRLYFNDMRTFGYLQLVNKEKLDEAAGKYGVEPFSKEFTFENFNKLTKRRKTSIKAFLLNQALIAGLGNIYVDEVLFTAGVRPTRRVNNLRIRELENIFKSIKPVLRRAIDNRGTTFNNYRDANGNRGGFVRMLKVYGRDGEKCKKCGSEIKKIKLAGRGTHFCPICQK